MGRPGPKEDAMKMIVAILQPHRLDTVREALASVGVHGMTAGEVQGYGRQGGHKEIYRGAEYEVHFVPKVKIEVVVSDDDEDRAVEAIQNAAQTGRIGDGKIFVLDVTRAVRIRTGEAGEDAL
jgi:nitrogen regulatory protein PII